MRFDQNLQIRTSIEDSKVHNFLEGARLFRSTGDEGGKFCLKVPCASFRSSDRDDLFIIAGSKS